MNNNYTEKLNDIYLKAENLHANAVSIISEDILNHLTLIVSKSEDFLGVVNVLITSLVVKALNPQQDIRLHQASMDGGYSGRSIDTKYIVPFLKSKKLKTMKESGWLTRSLEQASPYTLDYKGKIRNKEVKDAFLKTLDYIEDNQDSAEKILIVFFKLLIENRELNKIVYEKLENVSDSISDIIDALSEHFSVSQSYGRARLPVLAMHSIYAIITQELNRYKDKKLRDLSSHTSADLRHGDIGDIQIDNAVGTPFEALEIKYGIEITSVLLLDSYNKFKTTKVGRYYILSTIKPSEANLVEINKMIQVIKEEHGCQVIVNGLLETIKYYLRLIQDTSEFLDLYTRNVLSDDVIRTEHKKIWLDLTENRLKNISSKPNKEIAPIENKKKALFSKLFN